MSEMPNPFLFRCVWIGYFIAAIFICLTGRIGAVYHISFPVVARSSFGIWGSLWPVFNRAGQSPHHLILDALVLISSLAMACIWYGVQSYIGGQCVTLMIRSIVSRPQPFSTEHRSSYKSSVAFLQRHSQWHRGLRHHHKRFCRIFPIQSGVPPCHMVPRAQDPSPFHCKGVLCSSGWHCLLHLGHRSCQRHWSNCSTTCRGLWIQAGMGLDLGNCKYHTRFLEVLTRRPIINR